MCERSNGSQNRNSGSNPNKGGKVIIRENVETAPSPTYVRPEKPGKKK